MKIQPDTRTPFPTNFERPFTPPGWLRSARNLAKTRFRRFPTFHFSTPKSWRKPKKMPNFEWPFTPRIWLRSASNFGKCVSDDSQHFIFRRRKFFFGQNFWWKFSPKKKIVGKSTNCLFLRSYGFLDLIGRCASKSYPQSFDFQLSTTFGGGLKEIVSIFSPTFGQKWLQPFSFFG